MPQRPCKVKWVLPSGATQFGALAVILLIDSLVAPHFFQFIFRMAGCLAV
ncbi:putative sugar transport system permease [Yersinia aldovae]|nr:putative sugar transport system permease [Yersinia aldovae]